MRRFYVGCHQVSDVKRFEHAFVSVGRLERSRSIRGCRGWVMDSGAFTEITTHGHYRLTCEQHAERVKPWLSTGDLHAVVAQDYMCEPFALARTGLAVVDHQRMTIERYDAFRPLIPEPTYVLPVLQGYTPDEYRQHILDYGDRIPIGAWVGVGSVCKRQGKVSAIAKVLEAILAERPDLLLHGFGVKTTALDSGEIRSMLDTADSMAWSYAARKQGRNGNDWREGEAFRERIERSIARGEWRQGVLL